MTDDDDALTIAYQEGRADSILAMRALRARIAELEADKTELRLLAETYCGGDWLEATNSPAEDRLIGEGVLERKDGPMSKIRLVRLKSAGGKQ